jgi:hypothetical protein
MNGQTAEGPRLTGPSGEEWQERRWTTWIEDGRLRENNLAVRWRRLLLAAAGVALIGAAIMVAFF